MSSSRRPPRAAQPSRRPRVAGLRKPEGQGSGPEQPTDNTETSEVTETTDTAAAGNVDSDTEPASKGSGSLGGTLDAEGEGAEQAASASAATTSRPTPRRKATDRGAPKPVRETDVDVVDGVAGTEQRATASRTDAERAKPRPKQSLFEGRRGYTLVAVLLVVAVVFGGLAVFFKAQQSSVSAATSNESLVDVAGTAEVKQAMSEAAERLFSLDFNDIDKTQRAADELLVGDDVKKTYDSLMADVRQRAPQQKLVVTVKATRSAVVALDGDRAKVMVYIDQTGVRQGQQAPSSGGAAMWLDGEKRDGTWKVTSMDTYASAAAPGTPSGESSQPSPSAPAPSTPGS